MESTFLLLPFLVGVLIFTGRRRTRTRVQFLLASALLLPYWVPVGPLPLISAIGLVILGLLLHSTRHREFPRWEFADSAFAVFAAAAIIAFALGLTSARDIGQLVFVWLVFYAVGRVWAQHVPEESEVFFFAVLCVALSTLAVFEFVFRVHPFVSLDFGTNASQVWNPIQYRGGLPRSEWAMGHSIALGCSIGIMVPFFAKRLPKIGVYALPAIALVSAGVLVTFSRAAVGSAAIAMAVSVVAMRAREQRLRSGVQVLAAWTLMGTTVIALGSTALTESAEELGTSGAQRIKMLELAQFAVPYGAAGIAEPASDGRIGYRGPSGLFITVDNTLLLVSLQFGILPAALLVLFLILVATRAIRNWRGPASISYLVQLGVVLNVATITQYSALFFLMAGLATSRSRRALHYFGRETPPVLLSGNERTR